MSENPAPQQKEIDLIDVTGKMFSGIGRGIKNIATWFKNIILWFFTFTKKYFWILATLTFLGAVGGFIKAKKQKPFYQTEMLVETQIIPRAQIADRINNLQTMIKDRNNTVLARELNLPVSSVEDVFFIKADVVNVSVERTGRKQDTLAAEELGPQFLRIRVRVWDNQKIAGLEQALVSFIENDPYTQERLEIYRRNNLAQQAAIQEQIEQLALFQRKNIEKSSSVMTSGTMPLMVQNEERTYVSEILDLKNVLLSLQASFELTRPLSVIQPFIPFERPVDRTLVNTILMALLATCLGYGFLLFREGWKRV